MFVKHSERKYATRASAELLDLYWQQRRSQPDLNGHALYEKVVAQRLGSESGRAGEIVKRAQESIADWPVERDLRFRDVVHYLIFDEYMRSGKAREGTKTNMGAAVAKIIPEEI